MRSTFPFIIAVAAIGCTVPPTGGTCPTTVPAATAHVVRAIAVGQPWSDATAVGQRAGYELHDAAGLQIDPTPDGFYLDLPNHRGLLVFRDKARNSVSGLSWVEAWDGPRGRREYHDVQTFDIPPATPAAR